MNKIIITSLLVTLGVHQVAVAKTPTLPTSWTGLYNNEQKIALFLQQNGTQVKGYSVLNGKSMQFAGSIQPNGQLTLKEQGQGNSVGIFDFQYKVGKSEMEGAWRATNGNVKPKFFSVNAQQCRYAKGQGNYPEASVKLLKDGDLHMPLEELQYMRNEIYARHGYAFANKDWARTFSEFDWYMPCYTNVEARLNDIEKQNVKRIKLVEPYSKDIEWGR